MKFSIIIPVYNRPDETDELLHSLTEQSFNDFEVIVVDDGSSMACREVTEKYPLLDIRYFYKPNSGPGQTRNYGAERAQGEYLIILDSDVILPPHYLEEVAKGISETGAVAFGGPDRAHPSFSDVQKAINYSMTSFFTTGGIRGGKKKMDKFYPRSFNMGVRRDMYLQLGGFSKMRFGEDIDFSTRIFEAGYPCFLFSEAWVYHKRRTDFRKFYRQVYNSGIARINLEKRHPSTLKLVHLLPAVFTAGVLLLALLFIVGVAVGTLIQTGMMDVDPPFGLIICTVSLLPLLLYSLLIFFDSSIKNRSVMVGLLSIPASFVQLMGYGLGFMESWWKRCVQGKDEFQAFEKTFYK